MELTEFGGQVQEPEAVTSWSPGRISRDKEAASDLTTEPGGLPAGELLPSQPSEVRVAIPGNASDRRSTEW